MRPSSPLAKVAPTLILSLAAALAACDLFTGPDRATARCADRPAVPHTGLVSNETWSAAYAHRVRDTVSVTGELTIEPGAEVCTDPGAALVLVPPSSGTVVLRALGTTDRPIRFVPTDSARPDFAISGVGGLQIQLSHVEAEHTSISAAYMANVSVTSSVLGGASIASYAAYMTLANTVVHGGSVSCYHSAVLSLDTVRIEASPTVGLLSTDEDFHPCTVHLAGIRLVGNRNIAALTPTLAMDLLSQPAIADSLHGNLGDTVFIRTGYQSGGITGPVAVVPTGVQIYGPFCLLGGSGVLRMEPGAGITITSCFGYFGPPAFSLPGLLAYGSASAPVRLNGLPLPATLGGSASQPSSLLHAEVSAFRVRADSGRTLLVDSSHFSQGASLALRAPGSYIASSVVEDAADSAAVTLGADGVQLRNTVVLHSVGLGGNVPVPGAGVAIAANDVAVDSCDISGSAADGIVVNAGSAITISHCNLAGNAGAGLNNLSAAPVDARNNWWGDPAGPNVPGAARVLGNVNYTPWATAPFQIRSATPLVAPTSRGDGPRRP